MANPQPDKHTRVSNELLEAILQCSLTPTEHVILLAVIRLTYGFQKGSSAERCAYVALSRLSQLTGLRAVHCSRGVSGLVQKGLLLRRRVGTRLMLGVQKDYDHWTCRRSPTITNPGEALCATLTNSGEQPSPILVNNKRKKDKRNEEDDARVREGVDEPDTPTPPSPPNAMTVYEDHWPMQGKFRELQRLVDAHGDEAVVAAIHEAALRETGADKLRYPILMVRRLLDSPASGRPERGMPRTKEQAESDDWWNAQHLYKLLCVNRGHPFARETFMRKALTDYRVELEVDFETIEPKDFVLRLYRKIGVVIPDFAMPLSEDRSAAPA